MKWKRVLDKRETKYYWIDFKLVSTWESLRTLVWRSKTANDFREEIKRFENASLIENGNMIMEQWTLNEETYDVILNNLMKLRSQFKWTDVKLVIITSTMKYYFSSPEVLENFESIIAKLMEDYHTQTGSDTHYFSRELYWSNWAIYPSRSKVASEFIFQWIKFNKKGLSNIDDVYFSKKLI